MSSTCRSPGYVDWQVLYCYRIRTLEKQIRRPGGWERGRADWASQRLGCTRTLALLPYRKPSFESIGITLCRNKSDCEMLRAYSAFWMAALAAAWAAALAALCCRWPAAGNKGKRDKDFRRWNLRQWNLRQWNLRQWNLRQWNLTMKLETMKLDANLHVPY